VTGRYLSSFSAPLTEAQHHRSRPPRGAESTRAIQSSWDRRSTEPVATVVVRRRFPTPRPRIDPPAESIYAGPVAGGDVVARGDTAAWYSGSVDDLTTLLVHNKSGLHEVELPSDVALALGGLLIDSEGGVFFNVRVSDATKLTYGVGTRPIRRPPQCPHSMRAPACTSSTIASSSGLAKQACTPPTQRDVRAWEGRQAEYTSALLGNALRATAQRARYQLHVESNKSIEPVRSHLLELIAGSDEVLLGLRERN
jgi:hypothetical protein